MQLSVLVWYVYTQETKYVTTTLYEGCMIVVS